MKTEGQQKLIRRMSGRLYAMARKQTGSQAGARRIIESSR